jgi:outer membrane lipoprotein-sorting protein
MFKRSILSLILVVGLLIPAVRAQELTLDQIIKKNEDALGGAEAINKIQTIKLTAKMIMGGGQMEIPMVIWGKRPHFVRSESSIQGKSIVTAYDGTTAWMLNPISGPPEPQKLDDKTAANLTSSDTVAFIGSLAGFKAAGSTVELLGKEDVEGSAAYKIKVTRNAGMVNTFFLDASTFLPIKTLAKISRMGQDIEIESYPSDYKKIDGVLFAHSTDAKAGGRSIMQMRFEKIEINVPVDDGIFKMPATEKPAPEKPATQKPLPVHIN